MGGSDDGGKGEAMVGMICRAADEVDCISGGDSERWSERASKSRRKRGWEAR